jgi:hypothetical protein
MIALLLLLLASAMEYLPQLLALVLAAAHRPRLLRLQCQLRAAAAVPAPALGA